MFTKASLLFATAQIIAKQLGIGMLFRSHEQSTQVRHGGPYALGFLHFGAEQIGADSD